jgi:hypothetical protein
MDPLAQTPTPFPELPQPQKTFTPKFWGVLVLIITVGVIASAGIWYWTQNQPDQTVVPTFTPRADATSNWQTYTNTQYGFTLTFPGDWVGYKVIEKTSAPNLPQKEFINFDVPVSTPQGVQYLNPFSLVILNGTKWNSTQDILNDIGPVGIYLAKNKQYTFAYNNTQDPAGIPSNILSEINQVAQSFKFTNSGDTSMWKTYTNIKYGYSIQYPQDWSINTRNANDDIVGRGMVTTSQEPAGIISGNYLAGGNFELSQDNNSDARDALSFQIAKPDPLITVDQFINSFGNFPNKKESLTINGLSAVRFIDTSHPLIVDHTFTEVLIKGDRVAYIFMYFNPELSPIISTFKFTDSTSGTWKLYSSDFPVYYNTLWSVAPLMYESAGQAAAGEPENQVGLIFTLKSQSKITWGGPQSACHSSDLPKFVYGVSEFACVGDNPQSFGLRAGLTGKQDATTKINGKVTQEDINAFGDFVLKNK